MRLTRKHFKIAEMLAALFTGSQNEQDEREFEAWAEESEGHKGFADRLLDGSRYEENRRALAKFQVEDAWNKIDKRLGTTTRRIFPWKAVMSSAAAVLVLLSVGVYYWWSGAEEKELSRMPAMYQIAAGTTGARLTLANGRTVDVVKDRAMELEEVDGTKIVTDSVGIDYSAKKSENAPEVINMVQTLTGMEYMLTLSDGTKVFLNAETKLSFPTRFTGERREVELEGEAYFEVSKDTVHPFVVKTGAVAVQVLGTSFNVRSYSSENNVATTLVSGRVAVSDGKAREEILPGEQAIYMKGTGKMEIKNVDVSLYTGWHSGKFIFKNETLEEMLSYLSRWYGFKYRFIDERAKGLQIGARLDRYDNMNPIVEMLRKTGLVNITQVDSMLYISSTE